MSVRPRVALTLTQTAHRVPGGTATSVLQLAGALVAAGDIDLVGVVARGDLRRPSTVWAPDPVGGSAGWPDGLPAAIVSLPLPVLYDAWARGRGPSVAAATGGADLVHVTVPMRVRVGDAPMVATVHDLFPLTRPAEFSARGAQLMSSGLDWVLRSARALMVPSPTVAAACVERGVDESRVTVVPWGAGDRTPADRIGGGRAGAGHTSADPTDAGGPDPAQMAAVRSRHGIAGPYVLFVGTIEPRKNLHGLLGAMARVDRADLTLVIVGPAGWGDDLDEAATGLASPIARLGQVPRADLAALYAGAAVVAYPSFEEGFGLPVIEAMSVGAPVVTSAGTATEDVAGDAALVVDPHDTVAMAAALVQILDDPALAARLGAAGRRRAAGYRWERAAELTSDVYRQVLAG